MMTAGAVSWMTKNGKKAGGDGDIAVEAAVWRP